MLTCAQFMQQVSHAEAASAAVDSHPSDALAWTTLGRARLKLECFDDALAALRMAAALGADVQADIHRATVHTASQGSGLTIIGRSLQVIQKRTAHADAEIMQMGTGAVVWEAGVVLAKYLEKEALTSAQQSTRSVWSGHHILELGCGTGVAGLAAALLGAHVVVTDLQGTCCFELFIISPFLTHIFTFACGKMFFLLQKPTYTRMQLQFQQQEVAL